MVSSPLSCLILPEARGERLHCLAHDLSRPFFEVGIYELAALDTSRPAETTQ